MKIPTLLTDPIPLAVIDGGKAPERNHGGLDAAHDCFTRAIVSTMPDKTNPRMRTTISDFSSIHPQELISQNSGLKEDENGVFWSLAPGDTVSIGLGFNIELPFGLAGFIHARGGSINKADVRYHLKVLNPNPIDHGFSGEPWAEIKNGGKTPFKIYRHSKLVQLTIIPVWMGKIFIVSSIKEGSRGNHSNGSTG